MDKVEILAVIKKKVYYAELPSKMDVRVMDDTLHVIIDADGVLHLRREAIGHTLIVGTEHRLLRDGYSASSRSFPT